MLNIRTVLHPTDFSKGSEPAFQLACSLARDYNARLVTLHVQSGAGTGGGRETIPEDRPHRAEVDDKLRHFQDSHPEVRMEGRFVKGDPAGEILREARQFRCDMIVMGTHGWMGLGQFLLGSVAAAVVRAASCPVVTVRTPPADEPFPGQAVPSHEKEAPVSAS